MKPTLPLLLAHALCSLFVPTHIAGAQGTALTYQGRLHDVAGPAHGTYDFQFTVRDALAGGNAVGVNPLAATLAVSNGLFTATLDPGAGVFTGADRWLEIAVRTNGAAFFTTLGPRQPLKPAPYALHADNAANLMSLGSGPLDIKVNGQRGLRLEATTNASLSDPGVSYRTGVNVVGGSSGNSAGPGVVGATIGGGGGLEYEDFPPGPPIPSGLFNSVKADFGTIGGGRGNIVLGQSSTISGGNQNTIEAGGATIAGGGINTIRTNALGSAIDGGVGNEIDAGAGYCKIGGGEDNRIDTNAHHNVIGGGRYNAIRSSAMTFSSTLGGGENNAIQTHYCTIGGGFWNAIEALARSSTIGGGAFNKIETNAIRGTIAGGYYNLIEGNAEDYESVSGQAAIGGGQYNKIARGAHNSTISGGWANTIQTNAFSSTIGGGFLNNASGPYAVVPGGNQNSATNCAFAAGSGAKADHPGAFVWADASGTNAFAPFPFGSMASNEFAVRATGGTRFVSAIDPTNGASLAGVTLAHGSGAWSSLSDRNAKENFTAANAREILDKVAALPLASWNYKTQDRSVRHLGPMAQDFHAAFNLGENERTITTVDADGVALAAIQGLNQKVEEKDARIRELERRLDNLERLMNRKTEVLSGAPPYQTR